ncbi:MAG: bifunctional (p)ppGpp synthetase/guanosine-3',5'-bis(diphosphate) 3'-pyrophosphohydrolase, partial [Bacteroidaceae bacterium]|nr:bifunctional (p)ppGpp synthetase/guanosine-3',5'-bis(diphosphate) 3'-pyrophosphohydrolase [Bacteroidaceae bacterium]
EGIREHLTTIFDQFTAPIRQELDKAGIKYEIKARFKKPYSIWSKMQTKHVSFDEVYDILAVRIIFEVSEGMNETDECFKIYNIASTIYKPHPDRLRDWVHNKKANGYQALHSTLMSKAGKWVEVQIRSRRMDDIAEHGFAAHWKYKDGDPNSGGGDDGLDKWLYQIKEILDDPQPNAIDFLDTIKLNLFANEIFVVTPKGEFKTMPAGCTVLDFAFSVHTFLGTHCIGAKVNHVLVGISHVLQSGDQVEVLSSKNQKVEKEWIDYATTAKAKGKIEAILRRMEREKQKEGEDILAEFLQKHEKEPSSVNIAKLCHFHALNTREELLYAIGSKTITLGDADLNALNKKFDTGKTWSKYLKIFKRKASTDSSQEGENKETPVKSDPKALPIDKKKPLILNEETIGRYTLCNQCHPIPGDDVLGYIDEDEHIIIHKRQCDIARRLKVTDGKQILAAQWDTHGTLSFPATLHIVGFDRVGVLHQITGLLSQQLNVNIHSVHIDTKDGLFTAELRLGVHDAKDIQSICRDLKKIEEVEDVRRF